MSRYLTPQQYRAAFDGMVETDSRAVSDPQLAHLIARAEAAIDAYAGLDGRLGGFEPHVITGYQEAFDFDARRARIPNFPAPARNLRRFNIHISNANDSQDAASSAVINVNDIAINNQSGYFEAVPLQAITYSLSAVVYGLGLQPPWVEMDYESGYYLPFLGDALYDTGDQTTYRAVRGFWATSYAQSGSSQPSVLPPVPPVIYLNGVAQPQNSGYTLNAQEGTVTFASAQTGGPTVTADYTAQIPDVIAFAAVDQVTWLLQQRALSQLGMGGLMRVQNGDQQLQRYRAEDTDEDQLCAKARRRLAYAGFHPLPLGGA